MGSGSPIRACVEVAAAAELPATQIEIPALGATKVSPLPKVIAGLAVAVALLGVAVLVWKRPWQGAAPVEHSVPAAAEVVVKLTVAPSTTVEVDGQEVGAFNGVVTLPLPAGRHRFVARGPGGTVQKDVLLLRGTAPTFDLRP
jgi:hypothetical protein